MAFLAIFGTVIPPICFTVGMPKIGAGLGGLKWENVREVINEVIKNHKDKIKIHSPNKKLFRLWMKSFLGLFNLKMLLQTL